MSDNLGLWNSVQKTPVEHTKEITGKSYKGNSPKPHWLVMRATEVFGPCGIGWGFSVVDERIEDGAGGEKLHIARVKVWFKWNGERGEVEHIGGTQFSGKRSNGKDFTDEDAPKKSVTDALVKALSMLGFAGDIFLGRYDDSKYVSELREEERDRKSAANRQPPSNDKEPPKPTADQTSLYEALRTSLYQNKSSDDVVRWWNDKECEEKRGSLPQELAKALHSDTIRFKKELSQNDTISDITKQFSGARVVNETISTERVQ